MMNNRAHNKPLVFISYSHNDRKWVDSLIIHLKPLGHSVSFDIWEDSRIKPGAKWRCEIEGALSNAAIAIFLVSPDFLASEFVMDEEVPTLIRNAEMKGTIIIPLLVRPSLFRQSTLQGFESINSPEIPLSRLSPHKRDEVFVKLAMTVETVMREQK
jgi:hypothetical protein